MVHSTKVSCRETDWEVTKHCFPSNMEMMAHVLLDGYEAKGTWWPTRNEQTGIPMWFQTLWLMFVYFSF